MLRRLLGFLRIGPDGFEPSPPVPKTPNEPEEKAERRSRTRRPNRSVRVDSSRKPAQPVPNLHVNLHVDGPGAAPGPVRFSENRTPLERLETMLRRLAEEGPSVYRAALLSTAGEIARQAAAPDHLRRVEETGRRWAAEGNAVAELALTLLRSETGDLEPPPDAGLDLQTDLRRMIARGADMALELATLDATGHQVRLRIALLLRLAGLFRAHDRNTLTAIRYLRDELLQPDRVHAPDATREHVRTGLAIELGWLLEDHDHHPEPTP